MPTLYILIAITLGMYLFYRIKAWTTKLPMRRHWIASKAQVALGSFVLLFGVNRLFLSLSTLIIVVSLIFILIGGFYIFAAIKAYRYYLPKAMEESRANS